MREHDRVKLTALVENLPAGTEGVIVHVYASTAFVEARGGRTFEVEFGGGRVVTVKASQLEPA